MSEEPIKTEQTTTEEPKAGEPQAETQSEQPKADDFREALSNLSAALDRFGRATEARARQEWREGKPELQRAMDEMKRGVEGLVRKSGDVFDSVSRRLNREDAGAKTAADAPEASATPEDETPTSTEQR